MGLLIDGQWHDRWYDTSQSGGRFERRPSSFRRQVTADGAPVDGQATVQAEPGRFHLYVSCACPWAHRTLIVRALKGLDDVIGVSFVHPLMLDQGWFFDDEHPDRVGGRRFLREVYTAADPHYTGRVTVPVLWDDKEGTIVNNESSEIIRMLTRAFDAWSSRPDLDLYPEELRPEIDRVNALVYDTVNNGVYKAGFATTQAAYDEAVHALFDTLDLLEARLSARPFLVGDRLTEADVRLFTTLLRFDIVYVGHFKCNIRRLVDYPALWAYTRALFQVPEIRGTCHLDHIKQHYYRSHPSINPHGIVPAGPRLDFDEPHDRGPVLPE
ncbi:MAG: glutathione S-transferase family protein [Deltaproteobacteria bacterium]|nr:MAG: glutathione S-transferase family protein [Deltaproteobacteria bacterium]